MESSISDAQYRERSLEDRKQNDCKLELELGKLVLCLQRRTGNKQETVRALHVKPVCFLIMKVMGINYPNFFPVCPGGEGWVVQYSLSIVATSGIP